MRTGNEVFTRLQLPVRRLIVMPAQQEIGISYNEL